MIIIEGIDRVGKSTLCAKIKEELGIPIFRGNYIELSNMKNKVINDEKINTLVQMAEQIPQQEFVCDRLHWSEFVYGIVNRGYTNNYMLEIEKRLAKMNTKIILVNPTDIMRSSLEHGSELKEHQQIFKDLYSVTLLDKFSGEYESLNKAIEWLKGDG